MLLIQIIILAIVQGLALGVALHVGTLSAVVWYFRYELSQMIRNWIGGCIRRERVGDSRLAQALALIPGTSRSGNAMTAGLMPGLTRTASARFSFLLSIPVIVMAGGYESLKLIEQSLEDWASIVPDAVLAGLTAYLCMHWFLKLLDRIGMLPFVVYRLLPGAGLLACYGERQ